VAAVFFARLLPFDFGFALLPGPIAGAGVLSDLPFGAFCGVLGGVVGWLKFVEERELSEWTWLL
jgi:hypothetical protein